MPKLKLDSLEIHYEITGSGPLLVLHHGFGSWGRDWERGGWIDALERHARVLTFDSVGHGLSTRSHDPADHTVEHRASVVTSLADAVGADKFGFVGFSMGGRTGFELAATTPDRLSLLVIGGMHLLSASVEADRFRRRIRVLKSGRAKLIERPDGNRPANDALALAASHEALLLWAGADSRLTNHTTPTMLFCGEDDRYFANARATAASMEFEFVALPNTDHDGAFFSSDMAVDSVTKFVSKHLV